MYKQVIVVRADLKLGKGKLAAQASHASLQAYFQASSRVRTQWKRTGAKKVVVKVRSKKELLGIFQKAVGLPRALIRDAGLTQVAPGEATAVGIGPAAEGAIDAITGNLKLL